MASFSATKAFLSDAKRLSSVQRVALERALDDLLQHLELGRPLTDHPGVAQLSETDRLYELRWRDGRATFRLGPPPERTVTLYGVASATSLASTGSVASGTRRVVTVLWADLVGSTALGERLDSENYASMVSEVFHKARDVMENNGGTVEPYVGDAIIAMFGIPTLHEDDAYRAVRAAASLRAAIAELPAAREEGPALQLRIGVNTGEVVTKEDIVALSDTVNVAARLSQVADASEILLGDSTYRLVRELVIAEALGPLPLAGRKAPAMAWRLLALEPAPPAGRMRPVPMVNRENELGVLHEKYQLAVDYRWVQLVTVLGEAGIGKTRLVEEFAARVGDDASVLRGRCSSYGQMVYEPIVQILRQAAELDRTHRAAVIQGQRPSVTAHDESVIMRLTESRSSSGPLLGPAVVASALGHVLGMAAASRPLVVIMDDFQWAQPELVETLRRLTKSLLDGRIVLILVGRPELAEDYVLATSDTANSTTLRLTPLAAQHVEQLVQFLMPVDEIAPEVVERIHEFAAGNPLFVEELIAVFRDEEVLRPPPSIEALIAARLDHLRLTEQMVIERASVVGERFTLEDLVVLLPDLPVATLVQVLANLVTKELLIREGDLADNQEHFRFGHSLIHNAAYMRTAKAVRAELHERYAEWLEATNGPDGTIPDELIGFHLERAVRLRREVGASSRRDEDLARQAGERLAAAGHRFVAEEASARAVVLLLVALTLLPPDHPARPVVEHDLDQAQYRPGWKSATDIGHKDATGDLGGNLYYQLGELVAAEPWWSEAVTEADQTEVMRNLGTLLSNRGEGLEAERWWRKAADAGNTDAMYYVGTLFHERNRLAEAERWYRRAVDSGNVKAITNLGLLKYQRGDLVEAEHWWHRAADSGDTEAMRILGILAEREQRDLVEAEQWYRRAAGAGDAKAMTFLGRLYGERGDSTEAEHWYQKAANAGDADAMTALGSLLYQRGDSSEAERWWLAGANAGDVNAMIILGLFLQYEQPNPAEAERWYRKAVEAGNATAMEHLATLLENRGQLTAARALMERAEAYKRASRDSSD